MDQDILLRARDLESRYGDVQVLWGVSVDVRSRSIVAIVGANGAGKTTLLMTLSGAVRPKTGSIEFCGKDITGTSPHVSVSAGMVGVCLTAISLIVAVQNLSEFETFCDLLLVADALAFIVAATASFVALRFHGRPAGERWLLVAEVSMLIGLVLMGSVCALLAFVLI